MSKIKNIDGELPPVGSKPVSSIDTDTLVHEVRAPMPLEPSGPVEFEVVEKVDTKRLPIDALQEIIEVVRVQMAEGTLTYADAVEQVVSRFIEQRFKGTKITEATRTRMKVVITEHLSADPFFAATLKNTKM